MRRAPGALPDGMQFVLPPPPVLLVIHEHETLFAKGSRHYSGFDGLDAADGCPLALRCVRPARDLRHLFRIIYTRAWQHAFCHALDFPFSGCKAGLVR